MGIGEFLLLLICLGLVAVLILLIYVVSTTSSSKLYSVKIYPGEESFISSTPGFFEEKASVNLSVVIPAYNEEERLPIMLDETLSFLEEEGQSYEVIVVDDGSADGTSETAKVYKQKLGNKLRVLTLKKNRGKGGAVRIGVLAARGERILFADADGATTFSQINKLRTKMAETDADIVCGSRAHLEKESIAQRSPFRTLLMKGFHYCVYLFGSKSIRDTQCGFKLMKREFAELAFTNLHIERWAFDVELLKIAEMCGYVTAEIPVEWKEVDGSKLDPISASVQMFKDLFFLWLKYSLHLWTVRKINKKKNN